MNLGIIPTWLRWMIFLPVALLVLAVSYPLIRIGNDFLSPVGREPLAQVFSIAMACVMGGFGFVWVGATLAPSHKSVVAISLTAFYGLGAGCSFMGKIMVPHVVTTSWLEVLALVVGGTIGAIAACQVCKEASNEGQRGQS